MNFSQYLNPSMWGGLFDAGMVEMRDPGFWVAVVKIIWINILLSGDNALVIAMACRGLPPKQRFWGMVLGAGVAVVLRLVFTVIIVTLMTLPYLKIVGGLALLYIAIKLLVPEDQNEGEVEATEQLWRAVRLVAVADIVMSLDNVIAIAAAAGDSLLLLVFGLGVSIPLIVAGAALIMALLDKVPALVWAGAALLGWIAGEVIATDPVSVGLLTSKFDADMVHKIEYAAAALGAVIVLAIGGFWRQSKLAARKHEQPAA